MLYFEANALCNKSNGRCDIKAEKREKLESKSSHESDIWPPAASKNEVKYTENIFFQTLEAILRIRGCFPQKL